MLPVLVRSQLLTQAAHAHAAVRAYVPHEHAEALQVGSC